MATNPTRSSTPSERLIKLPPNYVYWGGSSLYVNLTSRCSASCTFCLRNWTWHIYGYDLRLRSEEEPTAAQVIEDLRREIAEREPLEVVFTGLGEPLLRLDVLLEVVRYVSGIGIVTRLDTNGHGALANPGRDVVAELKKSGLSTASVSLNAPDERTYNLVCRPLFGRSFQAVKVFIKEAVGAGIGVTATAVVIPGVDIEATAALAANLGAEFRARTYVGPDYAEVIGR